MKVAMASSGARRVARLVSLVSALVFAAGASAQRAPEQNLPYVQLAERVSDHSAVAASSPQSTDQSTARLNTLPIRGDWYYIVQLAEPPLAQYRGGINSLAAPPRLANRGGRLDVRSAQARAYVAHLESRQQSFVSQLSQRFGVGVPTLSSYQHAFNGVVIRLSREQVAEVAKLPEVKLVEPVATYELDTDVGPGFIGAPAIWNGTATGGAPGSRGEGVVLGIIDSGVNWESPSFAGTGPVDGYVHVNPLGAGNFLGVCDTQPADPDLGPNCNNKLIGAYAKSYDFVQQVNYECANPSDPGNELGLDPATCAALGVPLLDFPNALDQDGHGSHTASTAGGNVVNVTYLGNAVQVSGVANHANIVVYDVCHTRTTGANAGAGSCFNFATLAAIEQVVEDGIIDVINYSISGGSQPWTEANSLAFLAAVDAGVFVSASAGNSGPAASTVGHRSPWVSTVAASTHTRGAFLLRLTANGTIVPTTPAVTNLPLFLGTVGGPHSVDILNAPLLISPGIDTANDGCAAFSAGQFAGAVAVIRRGICGFSVKAQNAEAAGAIAVVIANNQAGNIAPGLSPAVAIPVFGLAQAPANALRDYVNVQNSGGSATASIPAAAIPDAVQGDVMASFSSRGPSSFEALKPDITGPGVNILAAYAGSNASPGSASDPAAYEAISGTSMSSPHNAGAAALVRAIHPSWTVAEVKSAMMLTSKRSGIVKEDGLTTATPFDRGAGRIDLNVAAESGLVMDETPLRMFQADPASGGDPSSLNVASLQNNACVGTCTWTRKVRSVASTPVTYTASFSSTSGVTATVTPGVFTISPGQTLTLTIEADVTAATFNQFNFGDVVLTPSVVGSGVPYVETVTPGAPIPLPGPPDYAGGFNNPTMACINVDTTGDVSGLVSSVEIDVAMTHSWIGDTVLKLGSPSGSVLGVMSRPGLAEVNDDGSGCCGASSNLLAAFPITFRDGAPTSAEAMGSGALGSNGVVCRDLGTPCEYSPAPGSVAQPPSNFAGFRGQNAEGVWTFCAGDADSAFDPGSLASVTLRVEPGSLPAPPVHLPMAVFAIEPAPEITLTPSSVSANGVQGGPVVTANVAIGNDGFIDLTWNQSPIAGTVTVWQQAEDATGGIVSDFFNGNSSGAYSASDFTLGAATTLTEIFTPGFDNTASLGAQPSVTWAIYPDAAGVPAGDPQSNPGPALWQYSANIGSPQLDITGDNLTLDLLAAGQNVALPAGTYWLTVFPTYTNALAAGNRWNWSQGVPAGAQTHLIDPGNLFGAGATAWTSLSALGIAWTDTAFRLTGSVGSCGAPWLSMAPTSGTVAPSASQTVVVSMDPASLAPGTHNAVLCIASNDAATPIAVLPVTFNVAAPPTNPSATGLATPATVSVTESSLLTVQVQPGTSPASTGIVVRADLTAIGGSATQAFADDGLAGDATAGDGIYSFNATVALATSPGSKSLPVTVTDAQARSANTTIALDVNTPTALGVSGGTATPAGAGVTETSLLTVTVAPGTLPPSSGIVVTADLSSIGGSAAQAFVDDGTGGDATAGDSVYSYTATVAAGSAIGATSFPVSASDAQSRSASTSIAFEVLASTAPSAVGLATPDSIALGASTLLTVTTTAGTHPVSTGLAVVADLSSIGGSAAQAFVDNGTGGDATAGDGVFSFTANVPLSAVPGAKSLPVSVSDAQARNANATIALTLTSVSAPSGVGLATPATVYTGESSVLTVAVTSGNPASTGVSVTIDLSAVGGSATQAMFDDGSNGDDTAGDGIFTFTSAITGDPGDYDLSATIRDAQSRSATAIVDITIAPPLGEDIFGDGFESPPQM